MLDWVELHLSAPSEAELIGALAHLRDENGWRAASSEHALIVLGRVETVPARVNRETGRVTRKPTFDPNFHMNLLCTPAVALKVPASLRTQPRTPTVVWA